MFNYIPSKDWILLICIGFIIVAVGHTIDFLLGKHEVERLHTKFIRFAEMLNHNTLSSWQHEIAKFTIRTFDSLDDAGIRLFTILLHPGSLLSPGKTNRIKIVSFYLIVAIFNAGVFTPVIYLSSLDMNLKYWIIGIFLFPLSHLTFLVMYSLYKRTMMNEREAYYDNLPLWVSSFATALYSSFLTLIAIIISVYFLPDIETNSYWFTTYDNQICPAFPVLLAMINFVADFLTVLIMIMLLEVAVRDRINWVFFALINIVWSGIICFFLYSVLLAIEKKSGVFNFHITLYKSAIWAKNFMGLLFSWIINDTETIKIDQIYNFRLIPIILSTFVPVSLYMFVLVFFSMSKPVIRLSSRFFRVMGEKDESVFKQLGVLISVWLFAVKAIYDYLTTS